MTLSAPENERGSGWLFVTVRYLTSGLDDGIVVWISTVPDRLSTTTYLLGEETLARRELVWGILREPPAPLFTHQVLLTRLAARMEDHVRRHRLGIVSVAPIDVVLDESNGLVLQPDIVFVATDRLDIVHGQIWGAPDLVVEIVSRGSARYDRGQKLEWYGRYGVRECWIIDPGANAVEVVSFARPDAPAERRRAAGGRLVRSSVLPRWRLPAWRFFD